MDITDIKQSLSTVISNHLECQRCKIIDRNHERAQRGYKCPSCGYISDGGLLYFSINTHILIDLIQKSYHSVNLKSEVEKLYSGESTHDIAVIIFFCTLREVLLDNVTNRLMEAQNLPKRVSERLLADNKFHIQKQDKLFRTLTGIKWTEAISRLTDESKFNYKEIDEFVLNVAIARNSFIHKGIKWAIDRKMSTNCMKNINGLIELHVALHNTFVHPYYENL